MKKSIFPCIAFLLAAAVIFTGCGGGSDSSTSPSPPEQKFQTADLAGDWALLGVNTGVAERSAFYGSISMSNSGFIASLFSSINLSGYTPDPVLSGTLTLDEFGFLAGTIDTNRPFSFFIDSGIMDTSETFITYIDSTNHATGTEFDLAVLIKKGGFFSDPLDIRGNWHLFGLITNSLLNPGAIYGNLEITALTQGGSFTQVTTTSDISNGSSIGINSAGVISGNLVLSTLAVWTLSSGKLDQSKTFGALTSARGAETNFVFMIKESAIVLTSSDLEGVWYIHGATAGESLDGTLDGTIVGWLELNSTGAVVDGEIQFPTDAVSRKIVSGDLKLAHPNGEIMSGKVLTLSSGSITINSGWLDQHKRIMAFTDTNFTRLYLLTK